MAAVLKGIPKEHLLFGSDIPFFSIERIAAAVNKFDVSASGPSQDPARERAAIVAAFEECKEPSRTGFSLSGFDRAWRNAKQTG